MLAAIALTSCDPEELSKNSVTINGVTYENVDAYCWLDHGFNVRIVLTGDGKTYAFGMVDAQKAVDHTWTIDENFGYGDRLGLQISYPDDSFYDATPVSGTQTIMRTSDTTYSILMDTVDENGKPFKIDVVAKLESTMIN
jgi:hypothetical protein